MPRSKSACAEKNSASAWSKKRSNSKTRKLSWGARLTICQRWCNCFGAVLRRSLSTTSELLTTKSANKHAQRSWRTLSRSISNSVSKWLSNWTPKVSLSRVCMTNRRRCSMMKNNLKKPSLWLRLKSMIRRQASKRKNRKWRKTHRLRGWPSRLSKWQKLSNPRESLWNPQVWPQKCPFCLEASWESIKSSDLIGWWHCTTRG